MQYLISLREANQHLPRYIHAVEAGNEIIITRRGKPVAKMVPLEPDFVLSDDRKAARQRLLSLMEKGLSIKRPFSREELHER